MEIAIQQQNNNNSHSSMPHNRKQTKQEEIINCGCCLDKATKAVETATSKATILSQLPNNACSNQCKLHQFDCEIHKEVSASFMQSETTTETNSSLSRLQSKLQKQPENGSKSQPQRSQSQKSIKNKNPSSDSSIPQRTSLKHKISHKFHQMWHHSNNHSSNNTTETTAVESTRAHSSSSSSSSRSSGSSTNSLSSSTEIISVAATEAISAAHAHAPATATVLEQQQPLLSLSPPLQKECDKFMAVDTTTTPYRKSSVSSESKKTFKESVSSLFHHLHLHTFSSSSGSASFSHGGRNHQLHNHGHKSPSSAISSDELHHSHQQQDSGDEQQQQQQPSSLTSSDNSQRHFHHHPHPHGSSNTNANSNLFMHSSPASASTQQHKQATAARGSIAEERSLSSKFFAEYEFMSSNSSSSANKKGIIGVGASGVVKLARRLSSNKLVAVKEFRKRRKHESQREYVKKLTSEYCIASLMDHMNVVKTFDIIKDGSHWYEILEYCSGGDLYSMIQSGYEMSFSEIDCLFKQLILGVSYLHSRGVAHRDIKPENLLIDDKGHLKITDFGVSDVFRVVWESKPHVSRGVCGSTPYIAPEEFTCAEYNAQAVDVWACGIVYYALAFRGIPWEIAVPETDPNYAHYLEHAGNTKFEPLVRLSKGPQKLIARMLDPNPSTRITIDEILKDDWFCKIPTCLEETNLGHKHVYCEG